MLCMTRQRIGFLRQITLGHLHNVKKLFKILLPPKPFAKPRVHITSYQHKFKKLLISQILVLKYFIS